MIKEIAIKAVESRKLSIATTAAATTASLYVLQRSGNDILAIPPLLVGMTSTYNIGRLKGLRRIEEMMKEGMLVEENSINKMSKKLSSIDRNSMIIGAVSLLTAFEISNFKDAFSIASTGISLCVSFTSSGVRGYISPINSFLRNLAKKVHMLNEEYEEKRRTAHLN